MYNAGLYLLSFQSLLETYELRKKFTLFIFRRNQERFPQNRSSAYWGGGGRTDTTCSDGGHADDIHIGTPSIRAVDMRITLIPG